jgi:hypothetical protein
MSKEKLIVDFKLTRFTRLLAGPVEMTENKGEAVTPGEAATQAAAQVVTMTMAAGGKAAIGAKNGATQASRNQMKTFLMAAATPTVKGGRDDWATSPKPEQPAKKTQQDDGEEEEKEGKEIANLVKKEEEEWQKKLRKTIMEAAKLTPEQAQICMQVIKKMFKEKVGEEARKLAKKVVRDEQELGKCRRSILMHNADKWVAGDWNTQEYTLAERVTSAIHRISGGMVTVRTAL